MAIAFSPGQETGRGDLDIFLTNSSGNVANAFSLTYAIYFFDPVAEEEVLIGSGTRTPVNPAVGEYGFRYTESSMTKCCARTSAKTL